MSSLIKSPDFSFISSILSNQTVYENFINLKDKSSESTKFFCLKCKKTPLIEFVKLYKIKLTCDCYNKQIFDLKYINNNFIFDLEDPFEEDKCNKYENYFKCKIHNFLFQFFCNNCSNNLCKECIKLHSCEQNDLIDFNKKFNEIKKDIKFIDNAFYGENEFLFDLFKDEELDKDLTLDEEKNNNDNIIYLKRIISTLLYEYFSTPNMEIINNINNVKKMLINDTNIYDKNSDMQQNYEIFSEYEYDYYINNLRINKDLIKKIEIVGYNFNMKILENAILTNLENINLKGNNISDISPLKTVNFVNLKILNLYSNQISDDMIKYIYDFNFPKLENLNFGFNNLKSFEIFKSIEHFKELKTLNLTSNHFVIKIPENFHINELEFFSLEVIDFSNGIFCDETIKFIFPKLKLQKLKSIDLTSNNLHKLDFILNIKECPLETLILTNNEIDESQLKLLNNFDNLREIYLKNNAIKNRKEVEDLVTNLKKLEKIIIYGNPLNLYENEKTNKDFMNEINEIFDNLY